ncbi:MAG TPA: hypothetical protein VLH84_02500 [Patescibacteria group bacterium]|nr:hypothetical protein [Patescibacteria group bacterium]
MTASEVVLRQPEHMSPAIQQAIDGLDLDKAAPYTGAHVAELQLTYGGDETQRAARDRALNQFDTYSGIYLEEVEQFMSSSDDYGLPGHINQEEYLDDSLGIFEDRDPSTLQKASASTEETHKELAGWLRLVAAEDPPKVDIFISELVEKAILFDLETYTRGAGSTDVGRTNRFVRDTQLLATTIAEDVSSYARSPALVLRYLDSEFMQIYGTATARVVLECSYARLRSRDTPNETGAFYEVAVDAIGGALIEGRTPVEVSSYLSEVAKYAPYAVEDLADNNPTRAEEIYEIVCDASVSTLALEGVSAYIESHPGRFETKRLDTLIAAIGDNTPTTEQLDQLVEGLQRRTFTHRSFEAARITSTHLADEQLLALVHSDRNVFRGMGERLVVTRRLARMGAYAEAYGIAHMQNISLEDDYMNNVTVLLGIYDETGDPAAREMADSLFNERFSPANPHYGLFSFRKATMESHAARKHGHDDHASAADLEADKSLAVLEPYYQRHAVTAAADIYCSLDLAQDAEELANMLWANTSGVKSIALENAESTCKLLVQVIHAYIRQGQRAAAATILATHFLSRQTYPETLPDALELCIPKP